MSDRPAGSERTARRTPDNACSVPLPRIDGRSRRIQRSGTRRVRGGPSACGSTGPDPRRCPHAAVGDTSRSTVAAGQHLEESRLRSVCTNSYVCVTLARGESPRFRSVWVPQAGRRSQRAERARDPRGRGRRRRTALARSQQRLGVAVVVSSPAALTVSTSRARRTPRLVVVVLFCSRCSSELCTVRRFKRGFGPYS